MSLPLASIHTFDAVMYVVHVRRTTVVCICDCGSVAFLSLAPVCVTGGGWWLWCQELQTWVWSCGLLHCHGQNDSVGWVCHKSVVDITVASSPHGDATEVVEPQDLDE